MKRIICSLIIIALIGASPALAAGKLRVTQENFHVVDSYSIYGYAFARVDNVGDRPILVKAGLLEIFDAEGDTITSDDGMNSYARYLQPDEYTYVYLSERLDVDSISDVDDYMLTITGQNDSSKKTLRLDVVTSWEPDVEVGYSTYNYMVANITNNTDETLYGISVILVLLDDDGNILYMESDGLSSSEGLTPGSSLVIKDSVSSSFMETFEANGFVPTTVDAIAYVYTDAE